MGEFEGFSILDFGNTQEFWYHGVFYYTILTLSFVFKLSKILTRMYPHGKVGVHAQGTKIIFGILEYLDMDLGILRYY